MMGPLSMKSRRIISGISSKCLKLKQFSQPQYQLHAEQLSTRCYSVLQRNSTDRKMNANYHYDRTMALDQHYVKSTLNGLYPNRLIPQRKSCANTYQISRLGTINHTSNPEKLSSAPVIDFSDPRIAYQSKSMGQLLRSYIVFSLCQVPILVRNSEILIKLSYKILGKPITNTVLRMTMFGHFCAGESAETIKPTVDYLQSNGIGSILDYAAESDVVETQTQITDKTNNPSNKGGVQCRVYDYHNEELCDAHKLTFEKCIRAVKSVSPTGFAAIKVTALGNPELIKRASTALDELRKLFLKFDEGNTGLVTKEQFAQAYEKFFKDGDVNSVFNQIDQDRDGKIDYIEWSNQLKLEELHLLTSHCRQQGPLANSVLNEEEVRLMKAMRRRVDELASLAQSLGVRLMIDAEHTYFQPLIDNITVDLMKTYNAKYPAIFGTYQMYLKDSRQRLDTDIKRAMKGNYKFAVKLVRGAYMVLERAHAKEHGLPDPINAIIEDTHTNYNNAIEKYIQLIGSGRDYEIIIASHNQQSVEYTLECMEKHNVSRSQGVYFGQLLGMSDNVTFSLGNNGYKAYKYVPYGIIEEVMPYLIRRAQENADALSGAKKELDMIKSEIRRRLFN